MFFLGIILDALFYFIMILLPDNIPVGFSLRNEGFDVRFCIENQPDDKKSGYSKLIYFLNLMPDKKATELDIFRQIASSGIDVKIVPVRIPGQTYKTTPQKYVERFYSDIVPLMSEPSPDGLIVTGAPLEQIPLPQVRYWQLLRNIMDWAQGSVHSTLYICWAAQAALAHFFGIRAELLPQKRFGIYHQSVKRPDSPLMSGLGKTFPMPVSRHAQVNISQTDAPWLDIIAENDESGLGVAASHSLHSVFITGHLEYRCNTLDTEYHRDISKKLPIELPTNYYENNNPSNPIDFSWEKTAHIFYKNWIKLL